MTDSTESARPIMASSVDSKRASKRFSTMSAPSLTAPTARTSTSAETTASTNTGQSTMTRNRLAQIKEWSNDLDRLTPKQLQQQRYAPDQERTDRWSKLALGAKLDRALDRRLTDQDAVLRPKLAGREKTGPAATGPRPSRMTPNHRVEMNRSTTAVV